MNGQLSTNARWALAVSGLFALVGLASGCSTNSCIAGRVESCPCSGGRTGT
jgi:hypothetical protein